LVAACAAIARARWAARAVVLPALVLLRKPLFRLANRFDFHFPYNDSVDDALVDGCDQNEEFYSLLLNNGELKKMAMYVFIEDVYNSLRGTNIQWTCSITRLLISQVLQNALHFAVFQRKLFKNLGF
jgi:hypothetical protein